MFKKQEGKQRLFSQPLDCFLGLWETMDAGWPGGVRELISWRFQGEKNFCSNISCKSLSEFVLTISKHVRENLPHSGHPARNDVSEKKGSERSRFGKMFPTFPSRETFPSAVFFSFLSSFYSIFCCCSKWDFIVEPGEGSFFPPHNNWEMGCAVHKMWRFLYFIWITFKFSSCLSTHRRRCVVRRWRNLSQLTMSSGIKRVRSRGTQNDILPSGI